jgi:hypothetical protein
MARLSRGRRMTHGIEQAKTSEIVAVVINPPLPAAATSESAAFVSRETSWRFYAEKLPAGNGSGASIKRRKVCSG